METNLVVLNKLNLELPEDPAISLSHTYPEELKFIQTCTSMLLVTHFTISKRWKPPHNRQIMRVELHVVYSYNEILFSSKSRKVSQMLKFG